ncbi:MAG: YfhO family protein, partial [Clostridioides sp.]|nr:YfhO family protein [Clostridioides sp.]
MENKKNINNFCRRSINFFDKKIILSMKNSNIFSKDFFIKLSIVLAFFVLAMLNHIIFIYMKSSISNPNTDSVVQMMQFVPFISKVINSGDGFWSFAYGLGGDVFSEFSYYYTTSPFFYLSHLLKMIFGFPNDYITSARWQLWLNVFKNFLMMIFMYALFRYEGKRRYSSIIGAVSFGFAIIFIRISMMFDYMTDGYVYLPLTVLGFRIWQKEKKNFLLILGFALTIINNFYIGYMSYIFYLIYGLFFVGEPYENLSKHESFNLKKSKLKNIRDNIIEKSVREDKFEKKIEKSVREDKFEKKVEKNIREHKFEKKVEKNIRKHKFEKKDIIKSKLFLYVK